MEKKSQHSIVLLSSPGIGHLIPFAKLAEQLVRHHHLAVTLITQSTGPTSKAERNLMESIPKDITSVVSLPPPPSHVIPNDMELGSRMFLTIHYSIPRIRDILGCLAKSSAPRLTALIVDIFGVCMFDLAEEMGFPAYIFYTSSCMVLSFSFFFPIVDATYRGAYKDLSEPLRLPGCVPLHGRDFLDPLHFDRRSEPYQAVLWIMKQFRKAKGILVNSFQVLEPGVAKELKEDAGIPPVYLVGPLTRISGATGPVKLQQDECFNWLDEQPHESVLYVCFGSGGTLTAEQTKELAFGLEMSGHRFLWVVRSPNDLNAAGTFFRLESELDRLGFLPEGFLNRTKDLGLVVPSWAPQVEILNHASIGGFLTHCGWNSVLESILSGVPMIAWPLYAEQRTNAVLLVDDVKVALRVRGDENGLAGREEVAKAVKCLMEGDEGKGLRVKVTGLASEAAGSLVQDGSSFASTSEVVGEWKNSFAGLSE